MLDTILSWQTLYVLLMILYVPACIGLIAIVLLQKGKNMGFAGAFGVNPGGDTVLGPRASRSLPVRMTYIMASAYIVLCMLFALIEGRRQQGVAPDKVDPAVAAAEAAMSNEVEGLIGETRGTQQPQDGDAKPAAMSPGEDAANSVDVPPVDEAAATAEPVSASGDVSEMDTGSEAQAEIETMPEEDTP